MSTIQVKLVNNFSGGQETDHTVAVGTTVGTLLSSRVAGATPDKALVRIRRGGAMFGSAASPIASDFLLATGDEVSVTPTKVPGALTRTVAVYHS